MNVIHRRGWEIPEHQATPEGVYLNRRAFSLLRRASRLRRSCPPSPARNASPTFPIRRKDLYPAKRNEKYTLAIAAITPEEINGNYNNFYEFGTSKNVTKAAQALKIRPWTVKIDGMVEKPFEIAIDDLIRKMPLEERLYRHRCVEAWSMTIPWTGFPLAKLVELAKPLASAKYVAMETFQDKDAPGFRQIWYPWPYTEGLTMAEANNELAFLVTGDVRQARAEADGRAAAPRGAVEVRLQVGQVDRALHASPTSGRRRSGKGCRRPSTASGRT